MLKFIILCTFAGLAAAAAPQQAYQYMAQSSVDQLVQALRQPHLQYGVMPSHTIEPMKDLQTVMAMQSGNLGSNSELDTQPQLVNFNSNPMGMTTFDVASNKVSLSQSQLSYLPPAFSAMDSIQQQQPQFQQQQQYSQLHLQIPQEAVESEPMITKRFFIHAAPADDEEVLKEQHVTVGKARKNYNIVFIKSSDKVAKKASLKITPAVNEEKTVIYVLNKKHDAADIDAQIHEPITTTAKPEVYFIKYKTAEEAAHAQQTIQAQYDALGGTTQITNEGVAPVSSVIGSLDAEAEVAGTAGATQASVIYQANVEQQTSQIPAAGAQPQEQMLSAQLPLLSNVNANNGYLPPARFYYR